jgi:hypothetical protein
MKTDKEDEDIGGKEEGTEENVGGRRLEWDEVN